VGRETEGNNGMVLAELLEFSRDVALIAVKDEHAIYALSSSVRRLVEVLNPI